MTRANAGHQSKPAQAAHWIQYTWEDAEGCDTKNAKVHRLDRQCPEDLTTNRAQTWILFDTKMTGGCRHLKIDVQHVEETTMKTSVYTNVQLVGTITLKMHVTKKTFATSVVKSK